MVLVVALGDGDAPLAFHLANRTGGVERRPGVANEIRVEARAAGNAADLPAVAEINRDGIIGMARRNNHRRLHLAVAHGQLDNVVFFQAQPGQRRAGNDRRVVPAQARHRLGQLLQPAHVRPAPVVHIRIGPEDDFEESFGVGAGTVAAARPRSTLAFAVVAEPCPQSSHRAAPCASRFQSRP